MATASAAKKEYLCIIPDKSGALEQRLKVRATHLQNVTPLVDNGTVVIGGAMFDEHPTEGTTPSFKGSAMIVVAENEGQVWEVLRGDIYATSGVWDLDATKIIPFKSAVRTGL